MRGRSWRRQEAALAEANKEREKKILGSKYSDSSPIQLALCCHSKPNPIREAGVAAAEPEAVAEVPRGKQQSRRPVAASSSGEVSRPRPRDPAGEASSGGALEP